MRISILLIFFIYFSSCSNFEKIPLESLDIIVSKEQVDKEDKLLIDISNVLSEKTTSCDTIKEIKESKFRFARLLVESKFYKYCSDEDFSLESLSGFSRWRRNVILNDIKDSLFISKQVRGHTYLELGENERNNTLKEQYLVKAHELLSSDSSEKILTQNFPRYNKKIDQTNLYEVARDFEANREFRKARSIYRKIINSKSFDFQLKVKSWDRVRLSYKIQRDRNTYLSKTKKMIQWIKKRQPISDEYFDYSIKFARILWTMGDLTKAYEVLESLKKNKEAMSNERRVNSLYYMAGIQEELGQRNLSLSLYEEAFNEQDQFQKLNEDIVWKISWLNYRSSNFLTAIKWFESFLEEVDDNWKFKYWLAKSYKSIRNIEKAKKIFTEIYEMDNYGFYGQISSKEIEKNLEGIKANANLMLSGDKLLDWMTYFGQVNMAREYIFDVDLEDKLKAFYLANVYDQMIFHFFRNKKLDKDDILEKNIQFVFPQAFRKKFISNNKSKRVPVELLMSIARQESAFNPFARSHADAFGLLQIIPAQGKRLASKYNFEYDSAESLFNIDVNIAMASMLLEELIEKGNGNIINFLASYNAGPLVLERWRRENPAKGLIFVEEIPYSETRKYVKLIMRNFMIYKRINAKGAFILPEDIFDLSQY